MLKYVLKGKEQSQWDVSELKKAEKESKSLGLGNAGNWWFTQLKTISLGLLGGDGKITSVVEKAEMLN